MHFGEHQLRSPENPVTQDFGILASSSSSGTRLGLQSSGSPVHYKMGPLLFKAKYKRRQQEKSATCAPAAWTERGIDGGTLRDATVSTTAGHRCHIVDQAATADLD